MDASRESGYLESSLSRNVFVKNKMERGRKMLLSLGLVDNAVCVFSWPTCN